MDGCPLHKKNNLEVTDNNNAYLFGNPYSFLKLQRLYIDPLTPEDEKRRIIEKAKSENLPRIHQLLNKTNQMNLTTRRLSEKQLIEQFQHLGIVIKNTDQLITELQLKYVVHHNTIIIVLTTIFKGREGLESWGESHD